MREARLENRSIPLRLGAAPSAPRRRLASRRRRRAGVQFVQPTLTVRTQRLDALMPLVENILQTAGYLVLTIGAAVLLFHIAP